MGTDKALLQVGDVNLLQLALAKARKAAPTTVIVGSHERYEQYGQVIEDIIPGCGPLSGIHAALTTTQSELNLILSVDMPLISADFLRWLLQQAKSCDDLAIVPQAHGRTQPLCSVFRRAAQIEVERALRAEEYRVDRLFSLLPTRVISETGWRDAGFSSEIFRNVNTLAEFEALLTEVEALPAGSVKGSRS
jgi:molybdopterin-guanine dinucleotide biosynthesis protein A